MVAPVYEPVALAKMGRVALFSPWLARTSTELLGGIAGAVGVAIPALCGIAWDSRAVRPGDLFVALRGGRHDGHEHVDQAVHHGAVALLVERPSRTDVPAVMVADTRRALSTVSASLFDHPARRLQVIAVTGTDGKTTTTHLAHAVLGAIGLRAAAVSTLRFLGAGGESYPNRTDMTTPEAPVLHRFMAEQLRAGARAMVVETTSHALVQRRVDDCIFSVAAVTNLTPEHLDFHGSFAAYAAAKLRVLGLLEDAGGLGLLITHEGDPELDRFRQAWSGRALSFGIAHGQVRADAIVQDDWRCGFSLHHHGRCARVSLPMSGRHNVLNALAAASIAIGSGGQLTDVAAALGRKVCVPGRLQRITRGQPFTLVVDFAHTPNALEAVLMAMRRSTPGRLVVVFGSAGGRDAAKRPAMGRAVSEYADLVLLTADDPRDEDPAQIAAEIRSGMIGAGAPPLAWIVPDRREAIRIAVAGARANDTVLIAGKGGQAKMYLEGGRTVPWDDVAEAEEAVTARPE